MSGNCPFFHIEKKTIGHNISNGALKIRKFTLNLEFMKSAELLSGRSSHKGRRLKEKKLKANAPESPNIPFLHQIFVYLSLLFVHFEKKLRGIVGPTVVVSFKFKLKIERGKIEMPFLVNHYLSGVQAGIALPFLMKTVDQNLHLADKFFSVIFFELVRMQILLQSFKS